MSKRNSNPKKSITSQAFFSLLEDFPDSPESNLEEGVNQGDTEPENDNQTATSEELSFVPENIIKATEQTTSEIMEDVPETGKTIESLLEELYDDTYEEEDEEYPKSNQVEESSKENVKEASELAEEIIKEAEQKAAEIIENAQMMAMAQRAAEQRAQHLIKAAEKKTSQMMEQAKSNVQQIHQTAKESGYNEGITEGRQSAYEETSAQLSTLAQTLTNLISETAATKELIINKMEEEILDLTLTIASKLAGIELSINQNAIVDIAKQGLQLLKDKKDIVIKVSEDEFDLLKTHQSELLDFADRIENVSIEKDAALTVGDCQIYADSTLVDNTFKQRFDNAATIIWQSYHEGKQHGTTTIQAEDSTINADAALR